MPLISRFRWSGADRRGHRNSGAPFGAEAIGAPEGVIEQCFKLGRDWADLAIAELEAVHRDDWGYLGMCAANERFIGKIELSAIHRTLFYSESEVFPGEGDDGVSRDAFENR